MEGLDVTSEYISEAVPVIAEPTIEDYKKKVEILEHKITLYEKHGGARAYYSLNRKLNEIAEVLNSVDLETQINSDAKDKKFDRVRALWGDVKDISIATQALATMYKLTGDEENDSNKLIPFIETVAETRK